MLKLQSHVLQISEDSDLLASFVPKFETENLSSSRQGFSG
uniref:Uncharacterized protein n=1 Tax=Physcomitrium patens TaxID=3218 RepID=A0A2K1J4M4_PHYPA|nr:hypothetical protein PHYPA_022332 [Physcomitrium patens]